MFVLANADDSFITKKEYAQMLYKNPRGIGCNLCHGNDAKGKTIAFYMENKTKTPLKTPDITKLGFKKFYEALNSSKHKIMPKYFLTNEEIKILYYYVTSKK